MRVLHVNHSLDPVTGGGTAERTYRLARAMAREGAECTVLTLDAGITAERIAGAAPARVTALQSGRGRLSHRFALPRPSSARVVLRAVRATDVVSLMGHWTLLNVLAWAAARWFGKPHVVCPAGALDIYGRSQALKGLYNLLAGRRLVRSASGHVAVTAAERSAFRRYGVDPVTVTVIPNGVDPEEVEQQPARALVDLAARLGVGSKPFVLFVGRLTGIKGADLLVAAYARALAAVGRHHLVIVGPDEGQLSELKALAARRGVGDRVHFPGPLHGPEKTAVYRAAALLAVPSRREAMSIVAVEAASTGTPVLVTDACGFGEIAEVGGGLVVPATVEGIERGLRTLLADPAVLPGMGERLRDLVISRYTWERAAVDYASLFAALVRPPMPTLMPVPDLQSRQAGQRERARR